MQKLSQTDSTDATLELIRAGRHALIDVRSEGEFAQGSVPGFVNAPILTNEERHQVGLAYKTEGQDKAIELGHHLVAPTRGDRVAAWSDLTARSASKNALICCWRGGMRSQIACDWARGANVAAGRIEGGYKALRQRLLNILNSPPPLIVIAGLTGSGKTRLLESIPAPIAIDLEALAKHRGSTFGAMPDFSQPAQATFENSVALAMFQASRPLLIEDEGAMLGRLRLPLTLRSAMLAAPVIYLDASLALRSQSIFEDYVAKPIRQGTDPARLCLSLVTSIRRLTRRLGGATASQLERDVLLALEDPTPDFDRHAMWIEVLLTSYYDKNYEFAFKRTQRQIIFRGNYEECQQWILAQYA